MDEALKQKFLPDEYIFKQGEKGQQAYLLLDGRVAIEVNGKKVSEISEMEIFGEMSLILKKPRTASVKVLKPSIVLQLENVTAVCAGATEVYRYPLHNLNKIT